MYFLFFFFTFISCVLPNANIQYRSNGVRRVVGAGEEKERLGGSVLFGLYFSQRNNAYERLLMSMISVCLVFFFFKNLISIIRTVNPHSLPQSMVRPFVLFFPEIQTNLY